MASSTETMLKGPTIKIEGIPSEMKACQIVEFHKPPEIRTIPTPDTLRSHEILLKVAVSALCHSDLEYLKGTFPIKLPVTGSHEGTGVVTAVGSGVSKFKIGDRVLAGQTFGRCGSCDVCKGPEAFRHYCEGRETMMSVERNGAFQEWLVIDAREASLIPDSMSFATAAPLACAGATSWRGVIQADLKPGEYIGIVGSGGGLGHLAIQFAKAKGLKVVAVDARDEGIALSKEFGADYVLDARKGLEAMMKEVQEITGAGGVHATMNVSDHPTAAATSCGITRNHGTVVQIALIDTVNVPFKDLIFRDIHVKGSFMASQAEIEDMLHEVVKHKIRVENNIFNGLYEIPRAADMLRNGQYRGKACIIIDEKEAQEDKDKSRL